VPDAATAVAEAIARKGRGIKAQLRRQIDRLYSRHALAQRLFYRDGKLTSAGAEWLRRLARDNYVESGTYAGDRDRMLINEGRRALALEILSSVRLDTERLETLQMLEREAND
jgi:hypothetical protein